MGQSLRQAFAAHAPWPCGCGQGPQWASHRLVTAIDAGRLAPDPLTAAVGSRDLYSPTQRLAQPRSGASRFIRCREPASSRAASQGRLATTAAG